MLEGCLYLFLLIGILLALAVGAVWFGSGAAAYHPLVCNVADAGCYEVTDGMGLVLAVTFIAAVILVIVILGRK